MTDEHYCETGFTLIYGSDYVVDYGRSSLFTVLRRHTPLKRFNVGPGTTLCVLGMGGLGHLLPAL